jgi:hypothetical protein
MHHFVHAVVGSVALVAGIYLLTQPVGAAENPDNYRAAQLIVKKSMMQPYVATPADIAHAHELTQQFHAQKVPPVAMRSIPNQSSIRPSSWPMVKHDNPQSLGGGYVMQFVYPKPGVTCAVIRDEETKSIVNSDCGVPMPGAAR